ncbi:peptidoglycan-binding protein [Patescibacteria group bacterium]|nr:peptidoglycan-binding protein [Patescibacteria group bacterium]
MRKYIFFSLLIFFLGVSFSANAASVGEKRIFNVDPAYDVIGREEVTGILKEVGHRIYFYVDENWWNTLTLTQQSEARSSLNSLGNEFDNNIYSILTKTFGFEPRPGIDNDYSITILIHPMKNSAGGYFNAGNQYSKLENPLSNEKEMLHLNSDYINDYLAKSFLAHEFVHLISFNQKEILRKTTEEVWLNEMRAEYAPTLLGYDNNYTRSNLKGRQVTFLKTPSDSIVEWMGKSEDYGALNLFAQYLVDHYGIDILSKSLQYKGSGIDSLNYALKSNGFAQDFAEIFTDWTIASLINDCSLSDKYCYKNINLKNTKVTPSLNFLPLNTKSTLGVSGSTKNWGGNWVKFVGGNGTIKIEFIGNPDNVFKVPYVVRKKDGGYLIGSMKLNDEQRGEVLVSDIESIIIIPSLQTKTMGFISPEVSVPFFWSASVVEDENDQKIVSKYLDKPVSKMSQNELMGKIAEIQSLLNQLMAQLGIMQNPDQSTPVIPLVPVRLSCENINQTMNVGSKSDSVRCLQEFLKNQGVGIYPEGLVTSYFGNLTKSAVIRFQEKYAPEILAPFGISRGTGYVGSKTLEKINQLLTP